MAKTSTSSRRNPTEEHTLISQGTVIVGEVFTRGVLRIEGEVRGKITCNAKLSIGETGKIEGNIDAQNAVIAGEVKGKVVVRELLQLQEKGKIDGDIFTQKLSIQVGASFTGNCKMGKHAKAVLSREPESASQPLKNKEQSIHVGHLDTPILTASQKTEMAAAK